MILKVIFANSVDPDQTAPLGHKKTTFSDAVFLGALRVRHFIQIVALWEVGGGWVRQKCCGASN